MSQKLTGFGACDSRFLSSLGICLFVCSTVFGQGNRILSRQPSNGRGEKITLRGCLSVGPGQFPFAIATSEGLFLLTGKTSGLENYGDREVSVEGRRGDDIPVEGFFKPFSSFAVSRIVEVFPKREAELATSFKETTAWHAERNAKYGVRFSHPESMGAMGASESPVGSNFASQEGGIPVSSFAIPGEAYLGANFRGGVFTIFVNPEVTNRPSCMQFGRPGSQNPSPSSFVTRRLHYSELVIGSAAMGAWDSDYYFHIFQNGLCYELAFELNEFSAHTADTGCNIPLLSRPDELNLIKPLIGSVSFFSPTPRPATKQARRSIPQVTEFTASAETADDVTNRGLITFSWLTRGADYIEFTYTCMDPANAEEGGVSSVAISENGPSRYCQNTQSFKTYSPGHLYRSANSSVDIGFGYFNHEDPTSVVVTITPFSHGAAFPSSSKSIPVVINPYNPFQRGIPTATRNMTLTYAPSSGGKASYEQGSSLTIAWTDERAQDPCVNLYLVQNNPGGGEKFLLQINGKREVGCLKPASRGSYTWRVTNKYSGSGFRVLASTPGGFSGTLGAPFDILKPAQSTAQ